MDIAERQNISEKYLEGIVAALSRCGFLQTQRGRGGGYRLARCPEEYAVGDILRVAEGSIAPVSCVKSGESECPNADNCLTLPLWKELDRVMKRLSGERHARRPYKQQYCRKIDRFRE